MLVNTDKDTFYKFVKENAVRKSCSGMMHAENYYDKDDNIVAYMESSSWGAPTVYQIGVGNITEGNEGVINLVGGLIRGKE